MMGHVVLSYWQLNYHCRIRQRDVTGIECKRKRLRVSDKVGLTLASLLEGVSNGVDGKKALTASRNLGHTLVNFG